MSPKNKQIHACYSGRVQGVGFRFTVERLALNLGLSGWVKNLPDGRVEMVCEGEEERLHKFLIKLDQHFSSYIRQKQVNWLPAHGEFRGFEIRFF